MRPNLLDRSAVSDRPVNVQSPPATPPAPPEPPREIVVGAGLRVRHGRPLRATIPVEHLTPADVRTIRGDWPPEHLTAERATLDPLREALSDAWSALKRTDAEIVADRRRRALDPEGDRRPAVDPEALRAGREENVVRCEAALVRAADQVLGALRQRLPAEIADGDAEAELLVARAAELRRAAEVAEVEAAELVAAVEWRRRVMSPGRVARFADVQALAQVRREPDDVLRLPRQLRRPS